jgi:hypothetical protein
MIDQRREILSQVATGAITPEEGAARLEALGSESRGAAAPPPPAAAPTARPVREVNVITRFGNTEVIGDPTIAFAVADGPHQARQDGDTMVIEQSPITDDTAFEFNRPFARITIPGFDFHRTLTVRMNPTLALRTKVQAGNLSIEGVTGPVSTDVKAGNCTVTGFAGPIKLSVAAGNIDASGRLDGGDSSIRCQMGEVKVRLDKSSNVRINARTTMGEIATSGAKDNVVGAGSGILDVSCTMGNVQVDVV